MMLAGQANDAVLEAMRDSEQQHDTRSQMVLRALLNSRGQSAAGGARLKLVGLVTVRNSAQQVRFCLGALSQFVDAIVVLDDHSTDATVDIIREAAHEYRVEVLVTKVRRRPGLASSAPFGL